jgi:bleomycin hydrolase
MKKAHVGLALLWAVISCPGIAQRKDSSIYRDRQPGYFQNTILKDLSEYQQDNKPAPKVYKMNFAGMDLPRDPSKYKTVWFNDPVSQGNTNTCWGFSTISFYESEVYRLTKQKIKLSEMYIVYYEYIEKAKYYVKTHGTSAFAEGSESNAVTRIMKMYGEVPESAYSGLKQGQPFHTHARLYDELNAYLQKVKEMHAWNEDEVVSTVRSIMNQYIGEPPSKVNAGPDGKGGATLTPSDYVKQVLKLNLDDYVDVVSLNEMPWYTKGEYKVPDNWWHSDDYYNVPLADFIQVIKKAIRNGYSLAIGGDTSEPGLDPNYQVAMVPTFDIPSDQINDDAREMRFMNGSTTDDHGMHLVGYQEKDGKDWYLIKDSGSGSRNGGEKGNSCFGYYFFQEDYVKLKMMDFTVHKDALKDILPRFKK